MEEFLRTKVCTQSVTGARETVYEEGCYSWRVGTGDISTHSLSEYTLQRSAEGSVVKHLPCAARTEFRVPRAHTVQVWVIPALESRHGSPSKLTVSQLGL